MQLMVSELVTNCVRHAGMRPTDLIGVRVFVFPRKVRLEVSDDGPGFERVPPAPSIHSESGWGLFLVDQLADRWGVISQPTTSVWLEVDLPRVESV